LNKGRFRNADGQAGPMDGPSTAVSLARIGRVSRSENKTVVHKLVPEDVTTVHGGNAAVVEVQV
jgi:hypothetical protein